MGETRILVVEDDASMQRLISSQLEAHGYIVVAATDGPGALAAFDRNTPSLVLLDITLPGLDGLEVCRQIRAKSPTPIILVTAAQRPETKVAALDLGGDDYLTKPFNADELLARIRAVLRRAGAAATPLVIELDDLTIDLARHEVRRGDEPVHLTKMEFSVLQTLITHAEKVVPYGQLLEAVWGPGYDDLRAIHVHISNLRSKLERGPVGPRHILAVPGVGYRFRMSP